MSEPNRPMRPEQIAYDLILARFPPQVRQAILGFLVLYDSAEVFEKYCSSDPGRDAHISSTLRARARHILAELGVGDEFIETMIRNRPPFIEGQP